MKADATEITTNCCLSIAAFLLCLFADAMRYGRGAELAAQTPAESGLSESVRSGVPLTCGANAQQSAGAKLALLALMQAEKKWGYLVKSRIQARLVSTIG